MPSLTQLAAAAKRSPPAPLGWAEEALAELERTIGLTKASPRLRRGIASIARLYYENLAPPTARAKAIAKALEGIAAQATALRKTLTLDDDDETAAGWARAYATWEILPAGEHAALVATLDELTSAAINARKLAPRDRGGKLADPRVGAVIASLALLYRDVTGKRPGVSLTNRKPAGPFFRFARAFFQHAPKWPGTPRAPASDQALAKAIQRTLSNLRR